MEEQPPQERPSSGVFCHKKFNLEAFARGRALLHILFPGYVRNFNFGANTMMSVVREGSGYFLLREHPKSLLQRATDSTRHIVGKVLPHDINHDDDKTNTEMVMMGLAVKGDANFLLVIFTLANPLRGSSTCAAYAPLQQTRFANWNSRHHPSGCIGRIHGATGDQCHDARREASTLFDEFIEKLKDQEAEGDNVQKLVKETLNSYQQREGQRSNEQHGKLGGSTALLDEKRERVDTLKRWLDSFRPLPRAVIFSIKTLYDVLYTYNSNAIEGNTLTIAETELVVSHGIAVGGKTVAEHLEVIGHQEAIDYVETLSKESTLLSEYQIRTIHNLVCRGTVREEARKVPQFACRNHTPQW